MKTKKQELDVDFIGGEGSLTKEEEKAITAFLQARKQKVSSQKGKTKRSVKRTKVNQ